MPPASFNNLRRSPGGWGRPQASSRLKLARLGFLVLVPLALAMGCASSAPSHSWELDQARQARPRPLIQRWIRITEKIELRQPANIPRIGSGAGRVQLRVNDSPSLRTLGHVADGSVAYLLSSKEARKLSAKHGADCYIFSHLPKWDIISESPPRQWVGLAIKEQLLRSGFAVKGGGVVTDRVVLVEVNSLVLREGSGTWTLSVAASVGLKVSLQRDGRQIAQREIVGGTSDIPVGMVKTNNDNAKALQDALEDALVKVAQFIEQTTEFSR